MSQSNKMDKPSLGAAIAITMIGFILLVPVMAVSSYSIVNVMLMFGLAWYGWVNLPDKILIKTKEDRKNLKTSPNATPPVAHLIIEDNPLSDVDRDILRATKIADLDDVVTALHHFRKNLDMLLFQDFHDDIAEELNVIVEQNFPDLIQYYLSARCRALGSEATEADNILASSVRRLTSRLNEIASKQSRYESDRLRQHEEYLRQRHPVDTDPFSSIQGNI